MLTIVGSIKGDGRLIDCVARGHVADLWWGRSGDRGEVKRLADDVIDKHETLNWNVKYFEVGV